MVFFAPFSCAIAVVEVMQFLTYPSPLPSLSPLHAVLPPCRSAQLILKPQGVTKWSSHPTPPVPSTHARKAKKFTVACSKWCIYKIKPFQWRYVSENGHRQQRSEVLRWVSDDCSIQSESKKNRPAFWMRGVGHRWNNRALPFCETAGAHLQWE